MKDTLIVFVIASIIFGAWSLYRQFNEKEETQKDAITGSYEQGYAQGFKDGEAAGIIQCRMDPESCLFD